MDEARSIGLVRKPDLDSANIESCGCSLYFSLPTGRTEAIDRAGDGSEG
jgi:hypothetical protein